MKFLIQRVSEAAVTVEEQIVGRIEKGFLIFVGISHDDTIEDANRLIKKMVNLRIFEDDAGKTNLSLENVNGSLLIISQFTLYANCKKGNRPSFIDAASPKWAEEIYNYILRECKKLVPIVESGVFGAHMDVSLVNEGPFTIILE